MATLFIILFALVAFGLSIWLVIRSRRHAAPAAAGSAGAARVPEEAQGGDRAWVSRITQSIPTVVRRLSEPDHARPDPAKAEQRGGLGLQGNLAQTPLHDLMQFLALGRKSGVLEVASGRRTGRMVLGEGKVQKAAYRGKEGIDAAFLMLDLADGDFEFYESARAEAVMQAPLEVVDIIMLWMARKPRKKQAPSG